MINKTNQQRISGLVDNMQKRQRVLEKEINDLVCPPVTLVGFVYGGLVSYLSIK